MSRANAMQTMSEFFANGGPGQQYRQIISSRARFTLEPEKVDGLEEVAGMFAQVLLLMKHSEVCLPVLQGKIVQVCAQIQQV